MRKSIKTRLTLGVGLQFLFVVASVLTGLVSVNLLTADTRNILRANYDSLLFCRNMGLALEIDDSTQAVQSFASNLEKQAHNVTEPGEQNLTNLLQADYAAFAVHPRNATLQKTIRQHLHSITELNLNAIHLKSEVAQGNGKVTNIIMGTVGTLSFVFALVLLINLPSSIADPIKAFTESIQQIANKNYAWRVDESRGDEFGEMAKSFNAMAAKLEEYESGNLAKMLFEKRRNEALINQMHNPIIGFNEHQVILFVNDAALKVLNLGIKDLLGKPATEVAANNDLLRNLIAGLYPAQGANATLPSPTTLKIFADDKESYFEKEIVHINVNSGEDKGETYIGDVLILQNITHFKEQDAAKTHFIATVSHEFKTPISAIKMSLQLLRNEKVGALNSEQDALINSIQEDADRLLKITGTLLDLSQVESGKISLNVHPVPIQEIVDYALGATHVQAEQKGIRMEITYADAKATVLADSEKTAWVLTNLISNAIRYSYDNATVYLNTQFHDGFLRVSVRDTGQGIAPQYQTKVFERYFRVPGMRTEGTGLGLAISKEFIEAQGGKIGMESDLGSGSLFWVEVLVG
ncbi:MAG: sensor signal transduction histidine kinase [Bacteroidota bacterium]|jgi:signal transduction histidine kinase/HAMP domain-containing protein